MTKFLSVLGMLLFSGILLAAGEDAAAPSSLLGPSMAMAVAAGLCGLGQGRATMAACEGVARNPAAGAKIQTIMIIGLALIESLALYTLVIVFVFKH